MEGAGVYCVSIKDNSGCPAPPGMRCAWGHGRVEGGRRVANFAVLTDHGHHKDLDVHRLEIFFLETFIYSY